MAAREAGDIERGNIPGTGNIQGGNLATGAPATTGGGGNTVARPAGNTHGGVNIAGGPGDIPGGHTAPPTGDIRGGGNRAGANVIEKPVFMRRQAQYIPIC
jgi:hypothetical protein